MEILKRKNDIDSTDSKRKKIESENENETDSETEDDLLERLFGSKNINQSLIKNKLVTKDPVVEIESENEDKHVDNEETSVDDEDKCVWHDDDDDEVCN